MFATNGYIFWSLHVHTPKCVCSLQGALSPSIMMIARTTVVCNRNTSAANDADVRTASPLFWF